MPLIFVFSSSLPVKWVSFRYRKKEFNDYLEFQRRIFRDLRKYLFDHESYFSKFSEIVIYYDKGQHNLSSVLNLAFSDAPFKSVFHADVKPERYRLFQVADLVCTVELLKAKRREAIAFTKSEEMFFPCPRDLKKNVIRPLARLEI